MIAYELSIACEVESFLMLYLNLNFIVSWASVLLNFKLQFSVNFHCPFWQKCISTLFGVHTNFICNPTHVQINDRERLHVQFRKTCNAIFEKKLHKRRTKALEKLCLIDKILMLDQIKNTNVERTMKSIFR